MTLHAQMNSTELWTVDVFTTTPLRGNPLGVVFAAGSLSVSARQAIARETNLSETVFLSRPSNGGDYALKIHTVGREIPFAVHPAIGAAHAFSEKADRSPTSLVMECGTGLVTLDHHGADGWFVRVPEARFVQSSATGAQAARWLGLEAASVLTHAPLVVNAGVPWLMVELRDLADLAALCLDHKAIVRATRASRAVGVTVFVRNSADGFAARMRSFAPAEGIFEDPVCGSCAASLAALLRKDDPALNALPRLSFEQGNEISRNGVVHALLLPGGQAVGGQAVTVMRGHLQSGV
jgi:PhzF family phenazine biosynthesis protein